MPKESAYKSKAEENLWFGFSLKNADGGQTVAFLGLSKMRGLSPL